MIFGGNHVACNGREKRCIQDFGLESKGKSHLKHLDLHGLDNIKMDFQNKLCRMEWIDLIQG
jgi:hypothetical protein